MPLTVSEIADRITAPGADKAVIVERLQHWTRERLLTPIGERNPGTGRRRLYDDSALDVAAILNALANQGLHIGKQRHLMMVHLLAERARNLWRKKGRDGKEFIQLYLEVADFTKKNPQGLHQAVFLHEGTAISLQPISDLSIVVNLTRLFMRLYGRPKRESANG
ncbi:MAG: MerR family transcriptional regulator [Bradyrhizobium sp.]|nr:MerR family transcriptional regulator [Bradyrhizobium sp.]